MKKPLLLSIMILFLLLSTSCSTKRNTTDKSDKTEQPKEFQTVFTNLNGEQARSEVIKAMKDANLSYVDQFIQWVDEFNQGLGQETGLADSWTNLDTQAYQDEKIAANWKRNHEDLDTNSRLAVFLLLQNELQADDKKSYGLSIMNDIDELEYNLRYERLRPKIDQYIALFDEVTIKSDKSPTSSERTYIKEWKKRNVVYRKSKASLISVICTDPKEQIAYVAHAGILIEIENYLLFIEKLGRNRPYQVTKFQDRASLKEELLERRDYESSSAKTPPFLLENATEYGDKLSR
ncbi:membrane associated protein [Lachnospiraceae bacterium KM106-2]|nr:membrane associated protein [Lachnospiraceae bacterium KM106-2]